MIGSGRRPGIADRYRIGRESGGGMSATLCATGDSRSRIPCGDALEEPPIMLGFPDGKLGDYVADRTQIFRLTQRIAEEVARIQPDAVVTWGPDGGTAH